LLFSLFLPEIISERVAFAAETLEFRPQGGTKNSGEQRAVPR